MSVNTKVMIGAAAALTLVGGIALAGSKMAHDPDIQAYSAVADVPVSEVIRMASGKAELPDDPMLQPYCETHSALVASLDHDFGEKLIQVQDMARAGASELWGSEVMGTWTIVYPRDDGTACMIASGTGYDRASDTRAIFDAVGITAPHEAVPSA